MGIPLPGILVHNYMSDQWYLTEDDIKHYNHMLSKGYESELIELDSQSYLVFAINKKQYIGVAWPTVTGELDGIIDGAQVILEFHKSMHNYVYPHVENKGIKILLFPRFPDGD